METAHQKNLDQKFIQSIAESGSAIQSLHEVVKAQAVLIETLRKQLASADKLVALQAQELQLATAFLQQPSRA